jgi:hypothetical protein
MQTQRRTTGKPLPQDQQNQAHLVAREIVVRLRPLFARATTRATHHWDQPNSNAAQGGHAAEQRNHKHGHPKRTTNPPHVRRRQQRTHKLLEMVCTDSLKNVMIPDCGLPDCAVLGSALADLACEQRST